MLGAIIDQALAKESVRLFDLRPVHDYCFVADVAAAVARAITMPPSHALRTYNVGSWEGVSVLKLAETVLDLLGYEAQIEKQQDADRPTHADLLELIADIRAIQRDLDWSPSVNFREGLRQTVAWWETIER